MDRTTISWNLPNLITVPLMAFIAFLVVGLAWQLGSQVVAPKTTPQSGGTGF